MSNETIRASVNWAGREEADLVIELGADRTILKAELHGIGGPEFLRDLCQFRSSLHGNWDAVSLPEGDHASALFIRELLLKARGEWQFPYDEDELCHCRAVPTEVVDQAICQGAHTPTKVSALTSASTGCGTCRPNVEAIIRYRLRRTG